MQERINLAQWDNDNDPQMIKKIKDMNNMWFMYNLDYDITHEILLTQFMNIILY
jgi:hypothetical protein